MDTQEQQNIEPATAPPTGDELSFYAPASYRSPRLMAKVATACLLLYGVGLALALWVGVVSYHVTGQALAGETVSRSLVHRMLERAHTLDHIGWGLLAVAALGFSLWFYRAAKNATAFSGPLSSSPGMAVGYFYIPILLLWKPYQMATEIWRASDSDGRRPVMLNSAPPAPGFILAWWISWIVSRMVLQFHAQTGGVKTAESVHGAALWLVVGGLVEAVALLLAIRVVWSITRRQERAAGLLMPSARAVKVG